MTDTPLLQVYMCTLEAVWGGILICFARDKTYFIYRFWGSRCTHVHLGGDKGLKPLVLGGFGAVLGGFWGVEWLIRCTCVC
jgi:hypothetical protein